jgi:LPXTG-motif cell wall-anchored protein
LGETTTQELVNTGASTAISTAFGLVILSVLATLHFLARRKNYQN